MWRSRGGPLTRPGRGCRACVARARRARGGSRPRVRPARRARTPRARRETHHRRQLARAEGRASDVAGGRHAAADHHELGVEHERHDDDRAPGAAGRSLDDRGRDAGRRRGRRRRRSRPRWPPGRRPRSAEPARGGTVAAVRWVPERAGELGDALGAVLALVGAEEGHLAGRARVAAHELAADDDAGADALARRGRRSTSSTPRAAPRQRSPARRGCSRSRRSPGARAAAERAAQVEAPAGERAAEQRPRRSTGPSPPVQPTQDASSVARTPAA